jgi:hypothetical protein
VVLGLSAVTCDRFAVAELLVCGRETEFMGVAVGIIDTATLWFTVTAGFVLTHLTFTAVGVIAALVFHTLVVGDLTAVARDRDTLLIGAHLIVRAVIVSCALRRLIALCAAYQAVELGSGLVAVRGSEYLDIHTASGEGIGLTFIRVSGEDRRDVQLEDSNRSLIITFQAGYCHHIALAGGFEFHLELGLASTIVIIIIRTITIAVAIAIPYKHTFSTRPRTEITCVLAIIATKGAC